MGEIAQDVLDGACCERCGVYFTDEHGHPVLCEHCYKRASAQDKKVHSRARHPEI